MDDDGISFYFVVLHTARERIRWGMGTRPNPVFAKIAHGDNKQASQQKQAFDRLLDLLLPLVGGSFYAKFYALRFLFFLPDLQDPNYSTWKLYCGAFCLYAWLSKRRL